MSLTNSLVSARVLIVLPHVGWSLVSVHLVVETAGVADRLPLVVPPPERGGGGAAVCAAEAQPAGGGGEHRALGVEVNLKNKFQL